MWFERVIAEFDNGQQVLVYADLGCNSIYPTSFFEHFENVPVFNTYDLMLDSEPQVTLEDILNAISEKEKEEVPFPTA